MKNIKYLFTIITFFVISSVSAQTINNKWKQMRDYHELLSITFQATEEGDFGPIKKFSEELVSKAEALDVITMPQDLKNTKLEETIAILKKQTKLVNDLVKNKAPNPEIMRAFENLHDIYYRIVQLSEPKR